jgi:GTPase SAR1 family protein
MSKVIDMFDNLSLNENTKGIKENKGRKQKNNKIDESFDEIIESFFDLNVNEKPDEYKLLLTCLKCDLFDYSQYIKHLTFERYERYMKYIKLDEYLITRMKLFFKQPDFCLMKEIDSYILRQIE